MTELEMHLVSSRRKFLQVGSAALLATGIGCNSQPTPTSTGTQSSATTAPPSGPKASELPGTLPGTVFSKEYIQMAARFAYFWGWPMVNSFNRRVALTSVPEPGLRGGVLPNAPRGMVC